VADTFLGEPKKPSSQPSQVRKIRWITRRLSPLKFQEFNDLGGFPMKVVIVGDTQVGKTCLISYLVSNTFKSYSPPTIGAAFQTYSITTSQGPTTLQIWDTAGQEKYRALAPMYYRCADIAILVYDVTRLATFEALQDWCSELAEKGPANLEVVIAGNKTDLAQDRVVETSAARAFAAEHGAKWFAEVSAKTGAGVFALFAKAAEIVIARSGPTDIDLHSRGQLPAEGTIESGCGC
jgi:small GTP-binding protein